MEQIKPQHLFPFTFRLLLFIRFVDVGFQSEEEIIWRRDTFMTFFAPPCIHTWADLAAKPPYICETMNASSLPIVIKIDQVVQ